jgi:hypothetical protein
MHHSRSQSLMKQLSITTHNGILGRLGLAKLNAYTGEHWGIISFDTRAGVRLSSVSFPKLQPLDPTPGLDFISFV